MMIPEIINSWLVNENLQRGKYQPTKNNASSLGGPCARELVKNRLHPEQAKDHEARVLAIFKIGNEFERIANRWLAEAGIDITHAQLAQRDEAADISGKIDGMITLDGSEYILEIKSSSPFIFNRLHDAKSIVVDYEELPELVNNQINSLEHWFQKQKLFVFKYLAQVVTYLYLNNHELGLLLIIDKSSGAMKEIEVNLNDWLYLAEALLQRSSYLTRCVKKEVLPPCADLINYCPKFCNYYNSGCNPTLGYNDSFTVIEPGANLKNKEFCKMVDDLAAQAEEAKEYNRNKTMLKNLTTLADGTDEHTMIINTEHGASHELHMKRNAKGVVVRKLKSAYEEE